MMSKIRSFLLAILIVFTSLFGTACESDEEQDEPPQVRQQVEVVRILVDHPVKILVHDR